MSVLPVSEKMICDSSPAFSLPWLSEEIDLLLISLAWDISFSCFYLISDPS